MGDVNLEIKLGNLDERVIKIEESGGGSGGDGYITSVSNDFNVVNKKLSLSNGVTTKLSKVDTPDNLSVELAKKINKPASATDGQVLTYNGTSNEWEAQNAKGGSITEPTDLEKGIIGGGADVYSETETYGTNNGLKNTCIYNNKIYSAIQDSFSNVLPTDKNYWKETSISELKGAIDELNSSLKEKLKWKLIAETQNTSFASFPCVSSNYSEFLLINESTVGSGASGGTVVLPTDYFINTGTSFAMNNDSSKISYVKYVDENTISLKVNDSKGKAVLYAR